MKQMKAVFRISLVLLTAVLLLHVTGLQAFAAEKAEWRGTYDLAMKWINFFILVFVVVKFGKAPIMRFLRAQKDDVADEIARLDREKQEMIAKIQDAQATLAESDIRFAELKERIVRDVITSYSIHYTKLYDPFTASVRLYGHQKAEHPPGSVSGGGRTFCRTPFRTGGRCDGRETGKAVWSHDLCIVHVSGAVQLAGNHPPSGRTDQRPEHDIKPWNDGICHCPLCRDKEKRLQGIYY